MKHTFILLIFLIFNNYISAQLKYSNDELAHSSWVSLKNNALYSDSTFKTKIGMLNKNEKFQLMDSYYLMYDYMIAKITRIAKNSFDECKNEGFKLGDDIELITGLGESLWAVVHNGKIKYASFNFDYENDKLTNSSYDGCNMINGDIIKSTEKRYFIVKVKKRNGEIGYIRFITDGNHRYEFLEFIQAY